MTWLTNWNYREETTISNSGSALADYQISITIDTAGLVTAGKMQSDCRDIRFASSDGSTLLNYWIESGPNTSSTRIWVKIASILASPSATTIYLYYGNPSAAGASNGTNTFDFFDNFDDGDVSDWAIVGGAYSSPSRVCTAPACNYNISSPSSIMLGSYGYGWNNYECSASKTISLPSKTYIIHFYHITNYQNSSYVSRNRLLINDVQQYILAPPVDTWTEVNIAYTGAITKVTLSNLWYGHNGGIYGFFDNVYIRKYASPEPTLSIPANITATDITATPSETPCIFGICIVTIVARWSNSGGTDGIVIPNITIDTVPQTAHAPRAVPAGSYIDETFTVSGLSAGIHSICPSPN